MAYILPGQDLTAALLNQLVSDLLNTHAETQAIATSESTASTAYTDLATAGPAVTLTSSGTLALVIFNARMFNATATNGCAMSVAVSGATTIAASDTFDAEATVGAAGFGIKATGFALLSINPGSNTYTCKYRSSAATNANFVNRRLLVVAP